MHKILSFLLFIIYATAANALVWFDGSSAVTYHIATPHDKVVDVSLNMFTSDIRMVTGVSPSSDCKKSAAVIQIIQIDKASRQQIKMLNKMSIPVSKLKDSFDAFALKVQGNHIYAVGNNGRGTAYALLELSRMAGVSPWVWWGDNKPELVSTLSIADDFYTFQAPAIERRGIFINDEDWSIMKWAHETYEPAGKFFEGAVKGRKLHRIGAQTYKRVFELLLRLRANMIWPAMHEYTVPFYQVEGAMEMADSCGIIVGTSHCEPLMRNNTTEWSKDIRGDFNYLTNTSQVKDYWISRLKESAGMQNVYTIGMRGIHDGNMEGPKTLDEHTYWLQKVIDDQRDMLSQYVNSDVTNIPQVFVPYKEVLQIYENGLRVPDDVTLIWCDDNYGYLTRLPDSLQQQRSGGHGIYYHLSYWGRPHSYLWHTSTQPGLIYNELREAYNHNVRKQWIFNIHDPKIAAFNLELCMYLAWNGVNNLSLNGYTQQWFAREFGEENAEQLARLSREYFRLTSIRRPEFMGWNQIELDRKKFPGGKSPVADTEFSFSEFGNEADRYLDDYKKLVTGYNFAEYKLPESKRNALFSALGYRIKTAALFAERMLEAQRARMLTDVIDEKVIQRRNISIARSICAGKEIEALTQQWSTMENGKWNKLLDDHPQSLPVFGDVPLPYTLSGDSLSMYSDMGKQEAQRKLWRTMRRNDRMTSVMNETDSAIAFNASAYIASSCSPAPVEQFGHSMNAVPLPKGEWLEYYFITPQDTSSAVEQPKDYTLFVAVIPTQANDRGDIRFAVSIDGGEETVFSIKEPYRSEQWKKNVLRQQAVRNINCRLTNGEHTVKIRALDDHIILDQLMLDAKKNRNFYVIPTKKH